MGIGLYEGPEFVVTLANAGLCAMYGHAAEQVLGQPLLAAVPELQGQGLEHLLAEVVRTGQPAIGTEAPVQFSRSAGPVTRYYDFVYQRLHDPNGQVLGVLNIAQDVTERVQARQQLEQLTQQLEQRVSERTQQLLTQQAQLTHILGQLPIAVVSLRGPEHRFAFFNERYQQLIGQRAVAGQPLAEALPEAAEQGFLDLLDQVYRTCEPYVGTEILLLLDQPVGPPRPHYLTFTYQALRDAQEQVTGILASAVDMTEPVQARQQRDTMQQALLQIAQRQAQQRQDVLQVFAHAPVAVALLRVP